MDRDSELDIVRRAYAKQVIAAAGDADRVRVVQGDGSRVDFAEADVIFVNAGATRPADLWLDRLRDGGRLILPLTAADFLAGDHGRGAVFKIVRCGGNEFSARRISGVAIFPCAGMRDAASEAAFAAALATGRADEVRRLYRTNDIPEEDCWLRGDGWCLAYR